MFCSDSVIKSGDFTRPITVCITLFSKSGEVPYVTLFSKSGEVPYITLFSKSGEVPYVTLFSKSDEIKLLHQTSYCLT